MTNRRFTCDVCKKFEDGPSYTCTDCDFDAHPKCVPGGTPVPPAVTSKSATTTPPSGGRPTPAVGTRVKRGADWKWQDQDGGAGKSGVIIPGGGSAGWIRVKWENGKENNYRWSAEGKYDLEVIK